MKIIIGLGNPGKQYENTRHNIGFLVLDELQKAWGFPSFSINKKFDAKISEGEGNVSGKKVMLVKPQTFMNLSGMSVRKILDFYKLAPASVCVVQDELDLPLGKYKIATDSSAAGHNGIKNIIEHLGTQTFTRLRIGIATPKDGQATSQQSTSCLPARNASRSDAGGRNAHDFVLDVFTPEEQTIIQNNFTHYLQEVEKFIAS